LRGSSAIERILKQNQSLQIRVLVVWEPIATFDWFKPSGFVLARISDQRVVQFWDKDHLVAKELRQQFPGSQSLCCQQGGILWDVAALYPDNVQWGSSAPTFFDGAVLDVAPKLSNKLLENSASYSR